MWLQMSHMCDRTVMVARGQYAAQKEARMQPPTFWLGFQMATKYSLIGLKLFFFNCPEFCELLFSFPVPAAGILHCEAQNLKLGSILLHECSVCKMENSCLFI